MTIGTYRISWPSLAALGVFIGYVALPLFA